MHKPFDASFQFDERAVIGNVRHAALKLEAHRILGGNAFPRIGFKLLHAEADALRLRVEADNLHIDLLADLQRHVWPLFAEGRLKPQLEHVYPAKDVDAAFAALASNQVAGKLVLQLDASLA